MQPRSVLFLAALLSACSSPSSVGGPPSVDGTGGALPGITFPLGVGGTGGAGAGGAGAAPPTEDHNCGNSASTMTPLPADLLVVLDRSGSMTNNIANDDPCDVTTGTCPERWDTMIGAMRAVLARSSSTIRWGLKLFSTPGLTSGHGSTPMGCVVLPEMEVPIAANTGDTILAAMGGTTPNYNTPTRAAIETASAYLATVNDGRAKYILLATDGQPNCALNGEMATSPDLPATLRAIAAARAAGFKVYVIGVGPSAGNLDEMAQQGGTGKFYPALSPQSLVAALDTIVGMVASCIYTMDTAPPDPTNLGVYLDKQRVPNSPTDGWTLTTPTSVTFNGPPCERIKARAFTSIQVLFGCPGATDLPPLIP